MSIDSKALKALMEKCKEQGEELLKLDMLEAEARQAIAEVIEQGDIGSEAAQRKTGDARMRIDMVSARRKKLKGLRGETKALAQLKDAEAAKFNDTVTAALTALRKKFCDAMLPFFGGDVAELEAYVERIEARRLLPPIFEDFRRCYYTEPTNRLEDRDVVAEVKSFLAQVQSDSKTIGLV